MAVRGEVAVFFAVRAAVGFFVTVFLAVREEDVVLFAIRAAVGFFAMVVVASVRVAGVASFCAGVCVRDAVFFDVVPVRAPLVAVDVMARSARRAAVAIRRVTFPRAGAEAAFFVPGMRATLAEVGGLAMVLAPEVTHRVPTLLAPVVRFGANARRSGVAGFMTAVRGGVRVFRPLASGDGEDFLGFTARIAALSACRPLSSVLRLERAAAVEDRRVVAFASAVDALVRVPEVEREEVRPVAATAGLAGVRFAAVAPVVRVRDAVVPVRDDVAVRLGAEAREVADTPAREAAAPDRLAVARAGIPCSVARVARVGRAAPVPVAAARFAATGRLARFVVEVRRAVAPTAEALVATEPAALPARVPAAVAVAERVVFFGAAGVPEAARVEVFLVEVAALRLGAAFVAPRTTERPACFTAFLASPTARFVRPFALS